MNTPQPPMHSNEELNSRALTNIDDMNDSAAFQPLAMPSLLFQRSAMLNSITAGEDADPVDNATIVQGFVNSNPLPSPVQPREIMDFDVSSVDLSQLQQPRMVPVQRNTHATRSRTHRSNAPSPEKSPLLTSIYDHMKAVEELSLDAEPASVPARGVQLRATQAHVTTLVEAPTAAAPAQRKIRTSTRTSGRKRKQSPVTASGCESPLQLLTSIPMSESSEKSSSDQGLPVDKRERNKISAARYRKKRKTYITSLEKEVNALKAQLQERDASLMAERARAKLLEEKVEQATQAQVHQNQQHHQQQAQQKHSTGFPLPLSSIPRIPSDLGFLKTSSSEMEMAFESSAFLSSSSATTSDASDDELMSFSSSGRGIFLFALFSCFILLTTGAAPDMLWMKGQTESQPAVVNNFNFFSDYYKPHSPAFMLQGGDSNDYGSSFFNALADTQQDRVASRMKHSSSSGGGHYDENSTIMLTDRTGPIRNNMGRPVI